MFKLCFPVKKNTEKFRNCRSELAELHYKSYTSNTNGDTRKVKLIGSGNRIRRILDYRNKWLKSRAPAGFLTTWCRVWCDQICRMIDVGPNNSHLIVAVNLSTKTIETMQFGMFLYIFCCLMLPLLRMGAAIPPLIHGSLRFAKRQVYFYLESVLVINLKRQDVCYVWSNV